MRIRKWLKHTFLAICSFAVAAVVLTGTGLIDAGTVSAAEGGNDAYYMYTVMLYAGNQGTFSSTSGVSVTSSTATVALENSGAIRISNLQYGDMISVSAQASGMVSVVDSDKYYIRGIRESGKDNNTVGNSAFTVEGDREYVIAYGIKGDMVTYTVNYQDESGNALASSEVFYGVVGDSPVVAFRYIDGYQPQAYNLTRTLSSDDSANVFTFVYEQVTQASSTTGTTTTDGTTATTGTTTATTAGTAATTAGTADAATTTDDAAAAGTDDGTTTADGTTTDGTAADGTTTEDTSPEDVVSLDDEETPLANVDAESATGRSKTFMYIMIAVAAFALVALASPAIYFRIKRKK